MISNRYASSHSELSQTQMHVARNEVMKGLLMPTHVRNSSQNPFDRGNITPMSRDRNNQLSPLSQSALGVLGGIRNKRIAGT